MGKKFRWFIIGMQQRAIKQMIIPSQVWSVLKGDILYLTLCFVLNLKLLLKKVKSFFFFLKETFKVLWKCMTWGPDLTGMLSKAIPENVTFKLRPE